jgi:hypothetical protein
MYEYRCDLSSFIVVYYESRKRELKKRRKNEYRCDERLKTKVEESTCLTYTGPLKVRETAELWGPLKDISLALEGGLCFEKFAAGSVSFGCGHTYCNRRTCVSRSVDIFPECRFPVATRVQLFGTLPDIGGLLDQEPAIPDVKQVQNLASENVKVSLEEFHKRSEEDKTV